MATKIFVKPRARYADYITWTFKTLHSVFQFTYNSRTKLFVGERTGDNEYSEMSGMECRRVIDELGITLEELE